MHAGNAVKPTTSRTLHSRFHEEIALRCTINYAMCSQLQTTKKLSDEPSR
jgi:hypothetical protein